MDTVDCSGRNDRNDQRITWRGEISTMRVKGDLEGSNEDHPVIKDCEELVTLRSITYEETSYSPRSPIIVTFFIS